MPIIPRYESSEGAIPTPKIAVPELSSFAGTSNAAIAGAVSKTADTVSDYAIRSADRQGYFQAQALKSDLNVQLQAAIEDAKSAPLKEDDNGVARPRSETMVGDYTAAQKKIVDDVTAQAGNNRFTMRHLYGGIQRAQAQALKQMERAQGLQQQQERHAYILRDVDTRMKEVGAIPPAPPSFDDAGNISIILKDDPAYESQRAGIEKSFNDAVALDGMPTDMAEREKTKALSHMDYGRALKMMAADQAGWNEASTAGRNEWDTRLSEARMKHLNDAAQRAVDKRDETANQKRLALQRTTLDQYWLDLQENSVTPLTRERIAQDVKDHKIDSVAAELWGDKVDAAATGGWHDNPPLANAIRRESFRPDVDYPSFQRRVEGLTQPGGLSAKTAQEALRQARSISEARTNRADLAGVHAYQDIHGDLNAQMRTPPSLLGRPFDDTSDVLRQRAEAELASVRDRSGKDPEAMAKWGRDRLPFWVRQINNSVRDTVKALSGALPVAPPLTDPKTGFIEKDEFQKAATRIYQKYGIKPGQSGPVSPEADHALKLLEDIETSNQFLREKAQREPTR